MSDLRKKSGILYLAFFLFLVCGIASAIMAFAAQVTQKPIQERQKNAVNAKLTQVLPSFDSVTEKDSVYTALRDGKVTGYAVLASTDKGYGGEIEALVGFEPDGRIYRIVVTRHNETPGIGTKVVERKEVKRISSLFSPAEKNKGIPANPALDSYKGLNASKEILTSSATPRKMQKAKPISQSDVQFISGATVSSNAMLDLVRNAVRILNQAEKEQSK